MARARDESPEQRVHRIHRERAQERSLQLQRELGEPAWKRMMDIPRVFFAREGQLAARVLLANRGAVVEALKPYALFALDSALRLAYGEAVLPGADVHIYVTEHTVLDHLAAAGLIAAEPYTDRMISRPMGGPPRLLACKVAELPPRRMLEQGYWVVTDDRLWSEIAGEVGARADVFALLDGLIPRAQQ